MLFPTNFLQTLPAFKYYGYGQIPFVTVCYVNEWKNGERDMMISGAAFRSLKRQTITSGADFGSRFKVVYFECNKTVFLQQQKVHFSAF